MNHRFWIPSDELMLHFYRRAQAPPPRWWEPILRWLGL